jgi:UPF0755 protein
VLLLILAGGGVLGAYVLFSRVHQPFRSYQTAEQFVDIPPGASPAAIGRSLVRAGVVRDRLTFRAALWLSGNAQRLQAGEYRFDRALSAAEVIQQIVEGRVHLITLTFREGLTFDEMAAVFERAGFGSAASFAAASRNAAPVSDIDPAATDLEGYLFPDTYALPRRSDATRVVNAMVGRFREVVTPELRQTAAAKGLNLRQLVTLASIVEKETGRPDERPIIAAVYANRLAIGMGLQCDPTVIYALQRAGKFDGNLRRDDLAYDSPYNTYRYRGLPPGPIAAPGRASLEAAARPAEVDYLFFVSRNDGSHEFARTLAEHNRNVQRYQVQYFRDRRAGRFAADQVTK